MADSITVLVGGIPHEKAFDPSCPVCSSPLMLLIDGLITAGWAYPKLSSYLAANNADGARRLTPQALRAHVPHLVPQHAQERERLDEEAARRAGADSVDSLITAQDLIRLSLQRAYERVQDGAEVNVRDVTALLRLQQQMERDSAVDESAVSAAKWEAAVREMLWILRRHLRGPAWSAFVADLRTSEALKHLMPPEPGREETRSDPAGRGAG